MNYRISHSLPTKNKTDSAVSNIENLSATRAHRKGHITKGKKRKNGNTQRENEEHV